MSILWRIDTNATYKFEIGLIITHAESRLYQGLNQGPADKHYCYYHYTIEAALRVKLIDYSGIAQAVSPSVLAQIT